MGGRCFHFCIVVLSAACRVLEIEDVDVFDAVVVEGFAGQAATASMMLTMAAVSAIGARRIQKNQFFFAADFFFGAFVFVPFGATGAGSGSVAAARPSMCLPRFAHSAWIFSIVGYVSLSLYS